jgi:hypothetical protein
MPAASVLNAAEKRGEASLLHRQKTRTLYIPFMLFILTYTLVPVHSDHTENKGLFRIRKYER